jgi:tetratricopeptide (TPR) repeat protein
MAYFDRGSAKQAKGDMDSAIVDYTKTLQLKPDLAEAYYNRGIAKRANGDFGGAKADLNNALKLKPNFLDAQKILDALINK